MRELLRTNDPVKLSWIQALLADAGIEAVVLDTHTSILEGSIGAIPRRLCVIAEDLAEGVLRLRAAPRGLLSRGEASWCRRRIQPCEDPRS